MEQVKKEYIPPPPEKYEYDIDSEGETFKVELLFSMDQSLNISCYRKPFPEIIFEQSFTLDDLQKEHNFFKMYETIEESKQDLISIFDEKKIEIESDSNMIKICLTLPIKKNGKLMLNLPLKEIDEKYLVLNILPAVQNLIKKVESLTNEIKVIKSLPSFQKEIKKITNSLIGDIIKEKEDEEWLIEEVENILEYEEEYDPTIYFLYKATVHGDNYNNFHKHCDNYNNTLVIIESNDGQVFGGFTSQMWNYNNNNKNLKKDNIQKFEGEIIQDKFFLFNLNERIILKSQNSNGIYYDSSYSYTFIFGNAKCYELYVKNEFLSNGGNAKSGELYGDKNYSISGGDIFKIKEIEAYQFN